MNIKCIILFGLFLTAVSGNAVAGGHGSSSGYSFDGNGLPEYPNNGTMWASAWATGYTTTAESSNETATYDTDGNTVNYYFTGSIEGHIYADSCAIGCQYYSPYTYYVGQIYTDNFIDISERGSYSVSTIANKRGRALLNNIGGWSYAPPTHPPEYGISNIRVTVTTGSVYSIHGNTSCLSGTVDLYVGSTKIQDDEINTDDYYYFNYLLDDTTYKLIFDDGHEYEFTVDGSNIVYDYDACTHTKYRFEERCGNLIPDSEGFYAECWDYDLDDWRTSDFYAPSGILDISNSSAELIEIYTNTFIGRTGWVIDPLVNDTTYTLENPNIAWGLKVIVINDSNDELIDGAVVKVDQTCYCTEGYSTRQKMTVNGMVEFGDMSLQDASLLVMATGYKVLNEDSTSYSAFLSGRSNFSSKTWIVKMAPSNSTNVSTFYEPQYKVDIHFRNEDGNRTSQILDTDTEVYLYYENNNSEEEAMTLKFQSSSTHSYFIDEDSWTIAYDDIGHKTIPNADFTPWTYAYRAVIYNSSIYGWNITIPLTVRNGTNEETLHYENLTTNLWFRHESDGKIDYREDMQIVSHARSNNTTLMTIDLEVWKDGVLLCYTNLTETDYIGADFPYYYMYEPIYEYVPGSNYTAKMYGFDRTLLEVRYLDCITDTITRKNRLTIGVKDRFGNNLNNCYVYLEDWGSLPTGSTYYNSYEGIDNGYYRYKATKSGYSGTGWADITMSDDDEIVWYTLTEDHTNTSATQQKMTDEDIKGMFFPLMFFLLICIIFGGFKYVTN